MRSDDEEEQYDEDEEVQDEDEDEEDIQEEDNADVDVDSEVDDDGEGDGDDDGDGDGDGDNDVDVDGDGDGDGDEDEDEEDEDEDEEDEDEDEDDDDDGSEDDDDDMDIDGEEVSTEPSQSSPKLPQSPPKEELPAHLKRRQTILLPAYPPSHLVTTPSFSPTIEAAVGIPLPSAVHSLASTACLSYLLTGSQDGYVRCYDFWSSVNGAQLMTAQQRTVVGLGEGVNKAGIGRGWWSCEVDAMENGVVVGRKSEPVFSLACEGDGLWALSGTQSGPINLYTLRHSPGTLVASLKGHSNVVSCLTLLSDEKSLLSGSWDGTVKEWDLNTGQVIRGYPTHGAQLSSVALRPNAPPSSPSPSPHADGPHVSVSVGPDFFDRSEAEAEAETEAGIELDLDAGPESGKAEPGAVGSPSSAPQSSTLADESAVAAATDLSGETTDAKPAPESMTVDEDPKSPESYDPLFDDDDGEGNGILDSLGDLPPLPSSADPASNLALPSSTADANGSVKTEKPSLALALPGMPKPSTTLTPTANGTATILPSAVQASSSSSTPTPRLFNPVQTTTGREAAANIPLLSPTTFRSFSDDVFLTSSMDGQVVLIDRRVPTYEIDGRLEGVGRLMPKERAPPWCMSACWSGNGTQVLAGRRNGTVDIWDVRRGSSSTAPSVLRTLRTPSESGPISCVVALHDGRHVATASQDNIRLWNTAECFVPEVSMKKSKSRPPFKIIAGHHGGTISSMIIDPTCRFLMTASGDRGWSGESTKVVLIHEIKW